MVVSGLVLLRCLMEALRCPVPRLHSTVWTDLLERPLSLARWWTELCTNLMITRKFTTTSIYVSYAFTIMTPLSAASVNMTTSVVGIINLVTSVFSSSWGQWQVNPVV